VSVVGVGMRTHSGVAAAMFEALAEKGINIVMISTSEIKISAIVRKTGWRKPYAPSTTNSGSPTSGTFSARMRRSHKAELFSVKNPSPGEGHVQHRSQRPDL